MNKAEVIGMTMSPSIGTILMRKRDVILINANIATIKILHMTLDPSCIIAREHFLAMDSQLSLQRTEKQLAKEMDLAAMI